MENLTPNQLEKLSRERLTDAEALFAAKRFEGAFYVCGYAIELGLKYRICKILDWDEYPVGGKGSEKHKSFKTHKFDDLLHYSGIEKQKNAFIADWSVVMKWDSEIRYSSETQTPEGVKLMTEQVTMKEITEKIKDIIKDLESTHNPLLICALFLREDDLEKWDIIISASWLNPTEMESYRNISKKLQESLSDAELVQFSRIVLLNAEDPVVSYLQNLETISNGSFKELRADELSEKFKFPIKKAYLLRSQKFS